MNFDNASYISWCTELEQKILNERYPQRKQVWEDKSSNIQPVRNVVRKRVVDDDQSKMKTEEIVYIITPSTEKTPASPPVPASNLDREQSCSSTQEGEKIIKNQDSSDSNICDDTEDHTLTDRSAVTKTTLETTALDLPIILEKGNEGSTTSQTDSESESFLLNKRPFDENWDGIEDKSDVQTFENKPGKKSLAQMSVQQSVSCEEVACLQ